MTVSQIFFPLRSEFVPLNFTVPWLRLNFDYNDIKELDNLNENATLYFPAYKRPILQILSFKIGKSLIDRSNLFTFFQIFLSLIEGPLILEGVLCTGKCCSQSKFCPTWLNLFFSFSDIVFHRSAHFLENSPNSTWFKKSNKSFLFWITFSVTRYEYLRICLEWDL